MAPTSKSAILAIQWTANNHNLICKLLDEMGRLENFSVLFGRTDSVEVSKFLPHNQPQSLITPQNTTGDSKIKVCKRIGEVLFPALFPDHATVVGERIRGKINE